MVLISAPPFCPRFVLQRWHDHHAEDLASFSFKASVSLRKSCIRVLQIKPRTCWIVSHLGLVPLMIFDETVVTCSFGELEMTRASGEISPFNLWISVASLWLPYELNLLIFLHQAVVLKTERLASKGFDKCRCTLSAFPCFGTACYLPSATCPGNSFPQCVQSQHIKTSYVILNQFSVLTIIEDEHSRHNQLQQLQQASDAAAWSSIPCQAAAGPAIASWM